MIEATLTDNKRRRWNPFRRRRFVLRIPQNWQEVTPLARRERWWHWVATLPPEVSRKKVVRDLVPWRWRSDMSALEWGTLAMQLDWLLPVEDSEWIPLESFYHKDVRYFFPMAKGQNVTCLEFALCDDYYKSMLSGDKGAQYRVSACLWREEDDDPKAILRRDDARVLLNSQGEIEQRVKQMAGVPDEVHLQAVLWWSGLKTLVHRMYGRWLFEGDDEDDEDDTENAAPQSSPGNGPDFGWWGIFLDVAESGAFGPLEKVHQASIHDVCMFLVQKRARSNTQPRSTPPENPKQEED